MTYKYNTGNLTANRINADGSCESKLTSALSVDELAACLPADLPTAQQQRDVIQSQINTLESAPVYMNRFMREWAIKAAVIEAAKVGATEPMLYASSKGYRDIKDSDTLITSLRTQMISIV